MPHNYFLRRPHIRVQHWSDAVILLGFFFFSASEDESLSQSKLMNVSQVTLFRSEDAFHSAYAFGSEPYWSRPEQTNKQTSPNAIAAALKGRAE